MYQCYYNTRSKENKEITIDISMKGSMNYDNNEYDGRAGKKLL